ncbi:S-adenosyl-L-methionine-dependent methyltransferase [Streptomyces mashuensis]|uniref:S-adenosyl-L-methionine-dependent methyltransferase n=1 Tax=Streptomyces mashuensis TaxID=33904 RepID=A0A919EE92_9ACTN|nr:S-adenosyl-L-methionine-dependent methyltransferase [Streptomyces mashuensis]
MAGVRAHESASGNALFSDPYAADFLAAAASGSGTGAASDSGARSGEPLRAAQEPGPLARALRAQTVLRTRFYDDELLRSGCHQVVLLGAGLDTRAYRLAWPPGVHLYELDLPPVLEFKERVLAARSAAPRCGRTALPVDLLGPDWAGRLAGAGFAADRPTTWLAEGLLVYFTAEEAAGLLSAVGELSAPGSRLALERGRSGRTVLDDPSVAHITSLWKGGLGAGTADWLAARGWLTEYHPLDRVGERYGRPLANPSGTGFVTAVRPGDPPRTGPSGPSRPSGSR